MPCSTSPRFSFSIIGIVLGVRGTLWGGKTAFGTSGIRHQKQAYSSGLIVANADDNIAKDEIDLIISQLASLKIFPRQFLDEIAKGDVMETFNDAVTNLLRINPGMRDGMLRYMIAIVMSDKIIAKDEVELLYNFGESIGLSKIEVADAIAESIQQSYVPSLDAIC